MCGGRQDGCRGLGGGPSVEWAIVGWPYEVHLGTPPPRHQVSANKPLPPGCLLGSILFIDLLLCPHCPLSLTPEYVPHSGLGMLPPPLDPELAQAGAQLLPGPITGSPLETHGGQPASPRAHWKRGSHLKTRALVKPHLQFSVTRNPSGIH